MDPRTVWALVISLRPKAPGQVSQRWVDPLMVVASLAQWVTIVTVAVSLLPAMAAFYLVALSVAALFLRRSRDTGTQAAHLTVLVPAHDERDLIQRCVTSLLQQSYPTDLYEVVVVADNCTDDTADLARQAGASVLVRTDPLARGKGRALRWAMDRILAAGSTTEAFVIVDGDSIAHRHLLSGLGAAYERGSPVVQGDYEVLLDDDSARVRLRALGFLLFHRVRFSGRAALRLPCSLVGNGMLLSRSLLEKHPWDAYTGAEDLEYTLRLRLGGVKPTFAPGAHVAGPVPASAQAAQVQRERWEGGRLHVARRALGPLLRSVMVQRRLANADALIDLLVPPLGVLVLGAVATAAVLAPIAFAGLTSYWSLLPSALTIAGCAGHVLIGLIAGRAPTWMYLSLLSAPLFLLEKLLGLRRVLRHRADQTWIRTERPSDVAY